ncbi:MAG: hypothetical protein M3220_18185 [Chloroflexota bacterium]|nr:hypothetical protein [Chloroflexota bacterium]
MKRKFRTTTIALVLSLLVVMVLAGSALAQGSTQTRAPGTWASAINLQNMENSSNAVQIIFYDANGSEVFTHSDTLGPEEGKSYYLPALSGLASGQYSAVVQSEGELRAVVNSESASPNTGYAYNGMGTGEVANRITFPGLYKNYYGFWSEVVLQNTGTGTANVTLNFVNTSGTTSQAISATIPANSSRVFALQDLNQLPEGNQNGEYSLVVDSDQPLAGVANVWTAYLYGESTSYNAFIGGSTTAYAPSLTNNYYGFVSALTVQNVSGSQANGTITYSNGFTQNFSLAPGESQSYYQPNYPQLPSGNQQGVYSARVQSNVDVVTLVTTEDKAQGLAASYNGATEASQSVFVPVAMKAYYGYFTAITVQNVGNQATDITVRFATGQSVTARNVPPNGTYNFIQLPGQPIPDPLPDNTVTSAIVSSGNGQPLVAVVQENNPSRYAATGGGDFLFAYTASAP